MVRYCYDPGAKKDGSLQAILLNPDICIANTIESQLFYSLIKPLYTATIAFRRYGDTPC